jgi:hypothetical protein
LFVVARQVIMYCGCQDRVVILLLLCSVKKELVRRRLDEMNDGPIWLGDHKLPIRAKLLYYTSYFCFTFEKLRMLAMKRGWYQNITVSREIASEDLVVGL